MSELDLDKAFLQAIPYAMPNVMAFQRPIVNTEAKGGWWIRAGVPGQADIYVVVKGGRHIEVETKMASRKLRPAQEAWRIRCEHMGITYLVLRARTGETANMTVARWVDELRSVVDADYLDRPIPE